MKAQFGLHELAIEDALLGGQRPNSKNTATHCSRCCDLRESSARMHAGELDISSAQYVLSCRRNSEKGFMEVRAAANVSRSCCVTVPVMCSTRSWMQWWTVLSGPGEAEGDWRSLEERIFASDSSARAHPGALRTQAEAWLVKHAPARSWS